MCTMTSADFPLFLEYSEGPCNEFIPYSNLQQQAKVIATKFKLEFQSTIYQRNENMHTPKPKSKITSCDHVTNSQESMSTKGGPLNSAHIAHGAPSIG